MKIARKKIGIYNYIISEVVVDSLVKKKNKSSLTKPGIDKRNVDAKSVELFHN